jgi:hypothetical protein
MPIYQAIYEKKEPDILWILGDTREWGKRIEADNYEDALKEALKYAVEGNKLKTLFLLEKP